jgi:hypothetical protein
MSLQSKEDKRSGPAMSSTAKITKGDASEDALPTESVLLGPDNPTNAGGGGQDEQGEALVISEKAEVGEKMMNEPGVAVKRGIPATKQKMAYEPIEGKTNSPSGTAKSGIADMAAKEVAVKKTKKDGIIAEDPPQLKNPPELEFLGTAMSSKVPKDDLWFGDTSSSESATLVPNSPKIAGQKNPDKKEGALDIPTKATVGENLICNHAPFQTY